MTDVAGRRLIKVGEVDVVIKEITVADARALLAREGGELDMVRENLFADLSLTDLTVFTSLTLEQMDGMLPTQLREVVDAVTEMNRHFFELVGRLSKAMERR
ncbi:hypothetical protein [Pseudomonas nitroreducens]|uniref:hypothetical protein n=1 Tax=Pseudomonas nitroreducens TaxID=46680 RepID=UPI002D80074B|nr:hypothetical protein [Pseudomonas nitroreducens]